MKYYEDINKGQICTENYDRSGGKCKWGIYSSERHIGKTGNYIKIYGTDYVHSEQGWICTECPWPSGRLFPDQKTGRVYSGHDSQTDRRKLKSGGLSG